MPWRSFGATGVVRNPAFARTERLHACPMARKPPPLEQHRRERHELEPRPDPGCPDAVGADAIETLIIPRARDLGGFEVRRALPAPKRQMVGPFIFFDQMGPAEFLTDQGIDVRPHPHIGLGTVTYLYRGSFQHRDSTGADQIITPGALNWMVGGAA